ncbi:MAG: hypothetical protein IT292_01875 [Deltaproteobacteria bacterium]|nr:hypothetical protein [Deltaproteobacteria bacterium]
MKNFAKILIMPIFSLFLFCACGSDLPQMNDDQEIERALDKAEQAKKDAGKYLHQARAERMESEKILAEARGLMQRKISACEEAKKAALKKRIIKSACTKDTTVNDAATGENKSSKGNPSDPPYSPSDAPLSKQPVK